MHPSSLLDLAIKICIVDGEINDNNGSRELAANVSQRGPAGLNKTK